MKSGAPVFHSLQLLLPVSDRHFQTAAVSVLYAVVRRQLKTEQTGFAAVVSKEDRNLRG